MRSLLFLFILILSACNVPKKQQSLQGSYELIEWKGIKPDGSIVYPYGENAQGLIQYDSGGKISMQLVKSNRELLGTDDYESLDSSQILQAYQGFFSYYGDYEVDGSAKVITHTIEGCKNPDWKGRVLKRKFQLNEDELILRSDSVIGMDHILTWRRITTP